MQVLGASEAETTLKWKLIEESKCTAAGSVQEMYQLLPAPATLANLVQRFGGVDTQALSPMKVSPPAEGVAVSSPAKNPPGPLTAWPAWHGPDPSWPGVNSWPDRPPVNGRLLEEETVINVGSKNSAELEQS